jgi:protein SCO1/2
MRLLYSCAMAAALAALLSGGGCRPGNERQHPLRGQVLSVAPERLEMKVDHEAIPGLMAPMVMDYKVREARELDGIEPGDLIDATLVIVSNSAYLTNVAKRGKAPLSKAAEPPSAAASGFEPLKPGEAVPDAPFVDESGRARTFSSFKGGPVLVTFIYTMCPIPNFCPLMDRHFKTIQDRIAGDPSFKTTRLVSVSFDPSTDTPEVLKTHAAKVGADPARWTFLTGDRDEIDRFAMRFGVSLARQPDDPLNIAHNLRTAIVDAEGKLVKVYTGNEWTPDQLLEDLKTLGTAR